MTNQVLQEVKIKSPEDNNDATENVATPNIIDEENPFHIVMPNVPREKYTENPVLPQKIEPEEIKALE